MDGLENQTVFMTLQKRAQLASKLPLFERPCRVAKLLDALAKVTLHLVCGSGEGKIEDYANMMAGEHARILFCFVSMLCKSADFARNIKRQKRT